MAPVAHWFGLLGCRIFSSLMTAGTAYLSYLIARRILAGVPRGAYLAAIAPALVWLQPLTMTLAATTLGAMKVGDRANIETDVLGKYVLKHLAAGQGGGLSLDQLRAAGFIE